MNKDTLIVLCFILAIYELCIIATYDFPPSPKMCSEYKSPKRCECAWRKSPLEGDMCISTRYSNIPEGLYEISPQTKECKIIFM